MAITWKGKGTNDTANANSGTTATGLGATNMYGFNGNDTLTTLTTLASGTNYNSAYGGGGHDTITGNTVKDKLYGDTGNDSLVGGGGADVLNGGAGNNTVYGGFGNDTISGGTSATAPTAGKSTFNGEAGNDSITAAAYTTAGAVYTNYVNGGAGNDTLTSSATAGAGIKDVLKGGVGNDSLVGTGNATNTWASYSDSRWGVNVNLGTGAGTSNGGTAATGYGHSNYATTDSTAAGDVLVSIGNVTGSIYKDSITGSTGANIINGGAGNDTIDSGTANTGNDSLLGGDGNDTFVMRAATQTADTINGGAGTGDTIDFSNAGGAVTVNLSSVIGVTTNNFTGAGGSGVISGVENVIGSGFADTITAIGGGKVDAGIGADTIYSASTSGGADTLIGGAGADTYDLTANVQKDYVNVTTAAVDEIKGFDQTQGDRVYISLADYGITVAATASGVAGTAITVAGTGVNALYTANYASGVISGTTNHKLSTITVASDAIVNGATATAAHGQFLYDDSNGKLYWDADGTGVGASVQVAHFDPAQMTATVSGVTTVNGHALEASDFLFVA
jgi:Ca2+-binding RTX toxin-like protein